MKSAKDTHYPTLIMIRGLPGSGKSYLADALRKRLGLQNVFIADPDTADLTGEEYRLYSNELAKEGLDKAIHPFRWSRKLACDAISARKIVIWNQPFTIRGIFDRLVAFLQAYAHEHNIRLPVLLVEVEIDHAVAKERIAKRKQSGGHGPSAATMSRRIEEYESYTDDYLTISVHGSDEVASSVAAVMRALHELAQQNNDN